MLAWDDTGKATRNAVYDAGKLVSGQEVAAFFQDGEQPIVGEVAAPTTPIDVGRLLAGCAAWTGQRIRVTGTVLSTYECPKCPLGATCKPCFGNHFELGGPPGKDGKPQRIAVVGTSGARLPRGRAVTVDGVVNYSTEAYTIGPCMLDSQASAP